MNFEQYDQDTELSWNAKSPSQRTSGILAIIFFTLTGLGLWWWLK